MIYDKTRVQSYCKYIDGLALSCFVHLWLQSKQVGAMVKFAQVALGPAGSGKSTYCAELQRYCNDSGRIIHVINLDPVRLGHPACNSFALKRAKSLELTYRVGSRRV